MEATTDAIHAAVAEYNACRLSLLCGKASTTDVMYAGQAPFVPQKRPECVAGQQ